MRSKADIIRNWYDVIWVQANRDRIEELYRPAAREDCLLPEGTISVEEARELIDVLHNLVSDMRVNVIRTVEQGDWVSAFVEAHGFKVGTDTPVFLRWHTLVRVRDNLIVESHATVNYLSLFEQLGQLPQNAFELLLGGTVLH